MKMATQKKNESVKGKNNYENDNTKKNCCKK